MDSPRHSRLRELAHRALEGGRPPFQLRPLRQLWKRGPVECELRREQVGKVVTRGRRWPCRVLADIVDPRSDQDDQAVVDEVVQDFGEVFVAWTGGEQLGRATAVKKLANHGDV